jgi:hypothetical protein
MFRENHVIQFILHYLITNIKENSLQTLAYKVNFCNEQYHNTNCL